MEETTLQGSFFEKMMPLIEEYNRIKIAILQLRATGENIPVARIDLEARLKKAFEAIKLEITQDFENQ